MPVSVAAARRFALALPGSIEAEHFGRPSFRVGPPGKKLKIFATLWPDEGRAVVMVSPDTQDELVEQTPKVFSPVHGTWGLMGATFVELRHVSAGALRGALRSAWLKAAPKSMHGELTRPRTRAGASGTSSRRKK